MAVVIQAKEELLTNNYVHELLGSIYCHIPMEGMLVDKKYNSLQHPSLQLIMC